MRMSALVVLAVAILTTTARDGSAQQLDRYRWQNRLIVIATDGAHRTTSERQLDLLAHDPDAIAERHLIVVTLEDETVEVDGTSQPDLTTHELRQRYDLPPGGFHVLLLGKDGGVKLRSDQPVALEDLNALIDTMPMRQREMGLDNPR